MKNSSDMVLKAFLRRCPPEKRGALERFLCETERQRLEATPSFTPEINLATFTEEGILEKVHWSWFLPTLKSYAETEQKLFLSALPWAAKNLAKVLQFTTYHQEISLAAHSFLRQLLLSSLLAPEDRLLPIDYLPPSPLSPLLHQSKKELISLIDLLSFYDLAAELRQIVETKILKKIYSFLSEEEKKWLKNALAHKEHFALARIGLERWDGTENAFRHLLHRRGLARLGAALSRQNSDFIWYICHQLDIGRGTALFKLCEKELTPHDVSEAITRQIAELIS